MITKLALTFLIVICVKCQEENRLWELNCNTRENVSQAANTTFTATLRRRCDEGYGDYGCEMKLLFKALGSKEIQIPVTVKKPNGTGQHNFTRTILHYEWMTKKIKKYVTFNVTLHSSDMSDTVTIKFQGLSGCSGVKELASINFEGCQNHSRFRVVAQNQFIASYLDSGNIICDDKQNMSGRAIYNNGSEATHTWCMFDAKWEYADEIKCLYPIHAEVRVKGDSNREIITQFYNQSSNESNMITLDCSRNDGTQTSTGKKFLSQMEPLDSPNIALRPDLNGENVSCYFENNYTIYFKDDTATYLSTSTLNITFGPIPPKDNSFCSYSNGSIIFYSNPPADESSLIVLKGNDTIASNLTECCGKQYGVVGQMITLLNSSTVSGNLTLRANYSGYLTFYNVTPCDILSIPTENESYSTINESGTERYSTINGSGTERYSTITGSGTERYSTINGPGTERYPTITGSGKSHSSVIVAAAASVGVLILGIIGLIFICRWRNGKGKATSGDDKVENVNPLYGTSGDVVLEPESDEQVVNPLYGTTQSETEVYSVVDKRNKKGKAKKREKTSKGNEDFYASVDKGKGKSRGAQKARGSIAADVDTYAAVGRKNKKTKGAQKADQSTNADIDTYAVVDRTNKTVKGTGDDDLHGSTGQNE